MRQSEDRDSNDTLTRCAGAAGCAQSIGERARPAAARRRRRCCRRGPQGGEQLLSLQPCHLCSVVTPRPCDVHGGYQARERACQQGRGVCLLHVAIANFAIKKALNCTAVLRDAHPLRGLQSLPPLLRSGYKHNQGSCPRAGPPPALQHLRGFAAQGVEQLDDAGAGALAALLALVHGPHAPGAAASHCRTVTVGFIADVYTVLT